MISPSSSLASTCNMLDLHIWGNGVEISEISPESLACAWILLLTVKQTREDVRIVTSCNTNLSSSGKLPILIETKADGTRERYEGFQRISEYLISSAVDVPQSTDFSLVSLKDSGDPEMELAAYSLEAYIQNNLYYINKHNLYMNSKNYEKYTRKLFGKYYPFPMMYNQPLWFYNQAQLETKTVHLASKKTGFLPQSLTTGNPQTEYFNDDLSDYETEKDEVALSSLHERQILNKSKKKEALEESKNSLRCLHLLGVQIDQILQVYSSVGSTQDNLILPLFSRQLSSSEEANTHRRVITTTEILLFAYIDCLCSPRLPDRFIWRFLNAKCPLFLKEATEVSEKLNALLLEDTSLFRAPNGGEVPSLYNEIKYKLGFLSYS
ncbi:Piso0_001114 [Millerozyma farinosa CBS 7064]|uniref:Piso0_001114 protein n=1 Tax=Pichia sorbitophila (strain ATCC MYA-4447 / BCRC 22081 / CBS 7064 / NBRC 10061 / NRRL Y-12695) TaxID=559304 RepID=G8YQZ2_PICSO|nr:Piso0_001114 [Millerozyma farinosa CBS 7064]CCE79077.1 Piso0_001114 [Millerozyma farinosa CBS 7064]